MLPSFKKGLTLERIDNNKGYSKDNCKWATRTEQNRNSRKNVFLEFGGEKKCVREWAILLGIKPATLSWRIHKGWSIDKALTTMVI